MSTQPFQKFTIHLVYDDRAEEAVNFYLPLFPDSRIIGKFLYGKDQPGPEGTVCGMTFQLAGQEFVAVNGGPHFKFGQGMSIYVKCETQEEIDMLWEKLSEGGEKQQCGWLVDKFGVSWQIAPAMVDRMLIDADTARAQRVMDAVMKMEKYDIAAVQRAWEEG